MAQISIIVAITRNNAIGRSGDLLFHISEDLKQFKAVTMGHPIIMGRKTFESFPNGALPGRRNIVITRQGDYNAENIEIVNSLQAAVDAVKDTDEAF
ncbi:MAG: dihydrofolate reductase, partial [Muribaculaceae bacterium]|nr:dihydrofolate reductase [Muribaculaceae bacterium]